MKKLLTLLLIITFILSATATGTSAWRDFSQHKTNVLTGNFAADVGELAITKTVVNGDGAPLTAEQKSQPFAFTVIFGGGGSYPYRIDEGEEQIIESGKTIALKHGQRAVITDIPADTLYIVTETPAQGYAVSSANNQGNMMKQGATAAFTNTADASTGPPQPPAETTALTIQKLVEGVMPESDQGKIFTFTVYVNGAALPDKIYLKKDETSAPIEIPVGASYEVREDDYTADGYSQTAVAQGMGVATAAAIEVVKTNTCTGGPTVTIDGEKTWDLSKTVAGAALPESITVYLKHGDEIVDTAVVTKQDGAWRYSFIAPKYDAHDEEISYSVAEKPVTGFVAIVDGYNITNVWQESRQVSVRKVWAGDDKNRPKSIQVQLYRDGKPSGTPVSLSEANEWKYTWSHLDSGSIWTVDEAALPKHYTKTITGDQNSGFVITNTYTDVSGGTSVTVAGKKTWKHGANPKAKQPQKITVQIKNGSYIVKQQTVSAAENWQWSFTLPRYDSRGEAIHYTVSETNVPGYKKTVSGYDITNTFAGAHYPGDSPKTGDEGRPWLMILLMAASLAGAVAAWRYRRAA